MQKTGSGQQHPRTWRAGLALVALVTAMLVANAGRGPAAAQAAETARPADAVVASMCINTHPWYDWDQIRPQLVDLGIRCIRDGATGDPAHYRALHAELGIRSILITDYRNQDGADVRDYLKAVGPQAVLAVENNNEPRGFIGGPDWAADTRAHQIDLWNTLNGDPATADIPIATSSPLSGDDVRAVGDVSAYADLANVHNYYGGHHPETSGWGDDGYGSLDWQRRQHVIPAVGDKPFIATETGYHNALGGNTGHSPATEEAAGTYMPRLYLYHFMEGLPYTAPYELWDEGTDANNPEHNFGLLRHDYSPKPAYTATKNLIALLADPGPAFTPSSLDYTLAGETDDVRSLLLQQRDGTFYLALWRGVESYRVDQQQDVDVPAVDVTLGLGQPVPSAATCRPDQRATCDPVAVEGGQIALEVSDEVMLVRLGAAGPTPTPAPTATATPQPSPSPTPAAETTPAVTVTPSPTGTLAPEAPVPAPAPVSADGGGWLDRLLGSLSRAAEEMRARVGAFLSGG